MTDTSRRAADPEGRHSAPADFQVLGDATPSEIAAITAVLQSVVFSPSQLKPEPVRRRASSTWTRRSDLVTRAPAHGPGAWRASGRSH